jgi:hypothetical protein
MADIAEAGVHVEDSGWGRLFLISKVLYPIAHLTNLGIFEAFEKWSDPN